MALHETIQAFPADICITSARLQLKNSIGVQTSAFTGKRQTQVFPGQLWNLELEFLSRERAEFSKIEAFLLSLRGGAGRFRMGDPFQSLPLGIDQGTPLVNVAVAGSESFTVTGYTANIANQLKANDKVQIGDHLYSVLADVNSDSSGGATILVAPALRQSYATSTALITKNARGVFSVVEDPQFSRNNIGFHSSSSIQLVESL